MIYQDNPKPYRYTLTAKWPGVKMIFKFSLYDLYEHASTQEPLPGGHKFLQFW